MTGTATDDRSTAPASGEAFRGSACPAISGVACRFSKGGISVACQGEVHNVPELCGDLDLPPDTALPRVLLAAWQRWGVDGLARLDGVLAVALQHDGQLILYRDPSGLQNLYYAIGKDGRISFASQLSGLKDLRGAERSVARRAVHEYLRFGDITAPHTFFEGVHAVVPGQTLAASLERLDDDHSSATTDPVPGTAGECTFDAAVDTLSDRLVASIRARLAGARQPVAFLSGGVDSALICAMAARERPDLTAVTVGFSNAELDESPVAARIAAHLGLRHEVLRFDRDQLLDAFDRLATHADQPFADPAGPVTLLAFDHCLGRYDLVLDGTGADAAVGAMPPRHVQLAVGWASRLPTPLRLAGARLLHRLGPLAGYAPILDFEHPADTMIRWKGFSRAEIEALCWAPVSFEDTTFYRTFARFPHHAHFERYGALMAGTPDDRVAQAMRISGLTVRFPFCGRNVDHCIRQLRTEFKHLPGEPKRVLRAVLARYVPRTIWDGPKHGFNFPLEDFLRGGDGRLVREHLAAERWRRHGLLSSAGVEDYARRFLAGDSRLTFRVWALVVLGAWLEKHDEPD